MKSNWVKRAISVIVVAILLIAAVYLLASQPVDSSVWHVTCPQGVYSGDVTRSTKFGGGYMEVSTGLRIFLPNNCAWVEVK